MSPLTQKEDFMYVKIAHKIHEEILKNNTLDNKISSERELMKKYQVSRVTIRKSLDILEEDGIIYRIQGKGTFIRERKITQPISQSISFSKLAQEHGLSAKSKLVEAKMKLASKDDIEIFNISEDERKTVIYISRKRYLNGSLVSLEVSHFCNRFSFLLDLDLNNISLYAELESRGYELEIEAQTIEIINADKHIASQLHLTANTPVILVSGIIKDQYGNKINRVKEYLLAHKFKFQL